jgi:hypothetical protein
MARRLEMTKVGNRFGGCLVSAPWPIEQGDEAGVMPMLVEFEPPTVRVPSILLHSAGAAEVGFGSYGSDRSMSGLARGADLRNFPVQGRKSATGRAEELRAQRFCDVSRSLSPSRARYPGQMPDAP